MNRVIGLLIGCAVVCATSVSFAIDSPDRVPVETVRDRPVQELLAGARPIVRMDVATPDIPESEVVRPANRGAPRIALSPDHECEILDYTDYNGTYDTLTLYGDIPYELANLFDVREYHQTAEVYGAAVRIYDASNISGGCDLVLSVYENDGGVPGTVIYAETIPAATVLANAPGNLLFSFSSNVTITTSTFFIAYEVVGPAEDYISIGLNQNEDGSDNGRGRINTGATWITLADHLGEPTNLRLSADICYTDFHECYTTTTGESHSIAIPSPGHSDGILNGWGQRFSVFNDTLKFVHLYFYIHEDVSEQVYAGTNETNGVIVEIWHDDGAGVLN